MVTSTPELDEGGGGGLGGGVGGLGGGGGGLGGGGYSPNTSTGV